MIPAVESKVVWNKRYRGSVRGCFAALGFQFCGFFPRAQNGASGKPFAFAKLERRRGDQVVSQV